MGFIHCLDEEGDLSAYEKHGALQYILDLKSQGVVKYIGLSTHAPELANKVLDMQILDMMMFSINPMYVLDREIMRSEAVRNGRICIAAVKKKEWESLS